MGIVHEVGAQGVGVHHREHGGVEAEAESNGSDDAESESGSAAEAAERIPEVLLPGFEPGQAPNLARLFESEGDAAESGFAGEFAMEADLFGEVGLELV